MATELWVLVGVGGAVGAVGLLYGIIMVLTALSRAVSPEVAETPYKDPSRLRAEFRVARLMRDSKYEPVTARGRRLRVASAVAQGSPTDDSDDLRTDKETDAELVPASAKVL